MLMLATPAELAGGENASGDEGLPVTPEDEAAGTPHPKMSRHCRGAR